MYSAIKFHNGCFSPSSHYCILYIFSMTAQSLIFALFLLDILYSLVFSLDCLIIKRARVTLLPTHCIFICARLMLLCLPLLHTITTHNSLPHYQGRPQDLGGGAKNFFFQIWEFACREATCCAWRSHAHC